MAGSGSLSATALPTAAEVLFGNGYMSIYSELVIAAHPDRKVRFFNKGLSGNRITDLKER